MDYIEDVLDKLKIMGDHYHKLAMNPDDSITAKIKAANICIRCYAEIMKPEQNKKLVDIVAHFMAQINHKILRSEAYVQYQAYCLEHEVAVDTKNVFYEKVRKLSFVDKRCNSGRYFVPDKILIDV